MKMRFVKRNKIKSNQHKSYNRNKRCNGFEWEDELVSLIKKNSTNLQKCFDTIATKYNINPNTVHYVYYYFIRPYKTVLELKDQKMPNVKNRPRWNYYTHALIPKNPLDSIDRYLEPLYYDPGYGS